MPMRWLLFLSRVSFICGIFFVLTLSILIRDWVREEAITSSFILVGYVLGLIFVPLTNISYLGVLLVRRKVADVVPRWLIGANIFFLLLLLFFIFYWNDPYYHQG